MGYFRTRLDLESILSPLQWISIGIDRALKTLEWWVGGL